MRDPGSVNCNAAVESAASRDTDPRPSPFAQRVSREAQRRDVDRAQAEGGRAQAIYAPQSRDAIERITPAPYSASR